MKDTPAKRAVGEARTRDPQLGKLMLYQLSYYRGLGSPSWGFAGAKVIRSFYCHKWVRLYTPSIYSLYLRLRLVETSPSACHARARFYRKFLCVNMQYGIDARSREPIGRCGM